jgi:kynureninase
LHGLNPKDVIIEVHPKEVSSYIDTADILEAINTHGNETALVIFGGVNYYSGQVFDMQTICKAAHEAGAICGFDLAHAAGNIALELHDWNVDFACWCSYKYLNSGPGGVSGAFIHQRYISDSSIPRLSGWWGHDKDSRFKMGNTFQPIPTAEGWQLSNAPVLSMSAHLASLEIFAEAGFHHLVNKGKQLSAYLIFIINEINHSLNNKVIEIITHLMRMKEAVRFPC